MFHTDTNPNRLQQQTEFKGSAKILLSPLEKVTLYDLNSPPLSDVTLLTLNYMSTAATAAAVMIEYP